MEKDAGCLLLVACFWLLVAGCLLPVAGCWPPGTGLSLKAPLIGED